MILTVLGAIKEFLSREAAPTIKLPMSGKNGEEAGFKLVNPDVRTEWLDTVDADKNRYPEVKNKTDIPCLLVCMDEADDPGGDGAGLLLNIRVVAVCWNPGTFTEEHERKIDGAGYSDLVNLLERAKQKIMAKRDFEGKAVLEGGVKLKVYEEQPWPYWYGWLSFQVRGFGDVFVTDLNF